MLVPWMLLTCGANDPALLACPFFARDLWPGCGAPFLCKHASNAVKPLRPVSTEAAAPRRIHKKFNQQPNAENRQRKHEMQNSDVWQMHCNVHQALFLCRLLLPA